MNDDPNIDLDRRIAASRPAQPYPRSVRYHGAWVDGRQRVHPAVVALHTPNDDDELARIRRDDRRALALVLLFGAVIFATLIVGVLRAP